MLLRPENLSRPVGERSCLRSRAKPITLKRPDSTLSAISSLEAEAGGGAAVAVAGTVAPSGVGEG
jgi:hypothetical protein